MARAIRASSKGIRQACDACHFKKIRCHRNAAKEDEPCQRCRREGTECVFSPPLKPGRPRKSATGKRADAGSSSSSSSSSIENAPGTRSLSFQASPSSAPYAWDGADISTIEFPSAECPLQIEGGFPDLTDPEGPQAMVMTRLEQLSAFQQHLVAKRRQHSALFSKRPGPDAFQAIQEMLHITQKVTAFSTWLMSAGASFAWRKPMLASMSDETALMMVVSPVTLVLEVFIDILEVAFPSLKDSSSSSDATTSDSEDGISVIDPALLSFKGPCRSTPGVVPDVGAVQDLANPVCVYILLAALQEQLDAMRKTVDTTLAAFPRMDSNAGARGLLPAIVDQYLEKIRFVQKHISRASGDSPNAGPS
ncbi:C6 zinc finger domain protein [Colletotrichum musicola]|uniref:C6 zinc finger domain protein n=1 Tax=Colletotrichum musicola TaxID=2175873 RepID=A0A8H6NVX5_9PEZI|nr:C6 zinc finger domain protein [Colletotrichum musicola]